MNTKPTMGMHHDAVDELGSAIVQGRLAPGQVLTSEALEERLGASRSVIREAVRVLESLGLVTSRRRLGVVIAPRTAWNVFDPRLIGWRLDSADRDEQLRTLGELRRGYEPVAAELAAARATPEQCATLTGAVMDMVRYAKAQDLEAYLEADIRFHATLLAASGNEMLAALRGVTAAVLTGRTHQGLMPSAPNPEAIRMHSDIAAAVMAGDPAAARAAADGIIAEVREALDELAERGASPS